MGAAHHENLFRQQDTKRRTWFFLLDHTERNSKYVCCSNDKGKAYSTFFPLKASFVPEIKPEVGAWIMAALHQRLWFLERSTVLPPSSAHLPQDRSQHTSALSCSPASWRGSWSSVLPTPLWEGVSCWVALFLFIYLQGQVGGLSRCLCRFTS